MSKRAFVGVMVVALAVVVMAGGLLASNMGFKLNYPLTAGAGSRSNSNIIALPDNRQTGLNTAKNLLDDIGLASIQQVARYIITTDGWDQVYTGRKGSPADFALVSGEGNLVKMFSTVNYIIVGSDNPTLAYNLLQGDGGATSRSGSSVFAYNYHQTATLASQLITDIGGAARVQQVANYIKSTDGWDQVYTGKKGSPADFSLVPGVAYLIKMQTTTSYVPSHY